MFAYFNSSVPNEWDYNYINYTNTMECTVKIVILLRGRNFTNIHACIYIYRLAQWLNFPPPARRRGFEPDHGHQNRPVTGKNIDTTTPCFITKNQP